MPKKPNKKAAAAHVVVLNVQDITSNEFAGAFNRLINIRNIPALIRLKVAQITTALRVEQANISERRHKLLLKYVKLDDKGKPIVMKDKTNYDWKSDKDKESFSTDYAKILDSSVTIEMPKLRITELNSVELSPSELVELQPILSE